MPYRLTFKNTLPLIIKYLSIFPISLIYILILKFYTMPNHTTYHTHFWVYPHPLLTTVKLHTREHLYSHTHTHAHEDTTHNSLRNKDLNFGFQYEWGMIIPSPLRTRIFVPIPPPCRFFVAENDLHFAIIFSASDCVSTSYVSVLCGCRARTLLPRIVCAAEITFEKNVVV